MKKAKISVVLATFNEEENLARCLEAVRQLADEIIIVDGQSTDQTVKVAKKYGAKVIVTTNKPIFHINKQIAIDQVKGDWILQLDADEVVTRQLRKEILAIIAADAVPPRRSPRQRAGPPSEERLPVAYYIPRKNFFLGRWLKKGGQYPDAVIRLFRRGQAYLPCQSVHEQMVVRGKVGYLKGHLLHYTAPTFSRYLINANRYTSLTATELEQQKLKINLLTAGDYLFFKPWQAFLLRYVRYCGFQDGFPGFIFALFSGLHYPIAYFKHYETKLKIKN